MNQASIKHHAQMCIQVTRTRTSRASTRPQHDSRSWWTSRVHQSSVEDKSRNAQRHSQHFGLVVLLLDVATVTTILCILSFRFLFESGELPTSSLMCSRLSKGVTLSFTVRSLSLNNLNRFASGYSMLAQPRIASLSLATKPQMAQQIPAFLLDDFLRILGFHAILTIVGFARTTKAAVEESAPACRVVCPRLTAWTVRHAAQVLNACSVGTDGLPF